MLEAIIAIEMNNKTALNTAMFNKWHQYIGGKMNLATISTSGVYNPGGALIKLYIFIG